MQHSYRIMEKPVQNYSFSDVVPVYYHSSQSPRTVPQNRPNLTQKFESSMSNEYANVIELEERLSKTVMKCTARKLRETMDSIAISLDYIQQADTVAARRVYLQLIHAMIRTIYKSGISLHEVLRNHADYHADIEQFQTKQEIHEFVEQLCISICSNLADPRIDKYHRIVWEVTSYIDEHFNQDFGLGQLSERMNCSSTYINRLLKQHTGSTFYNLLTEKRIIHSKQLLSMNDLTINRISEEVGYNNVHSFIRAFKRSEGITPGQFREFLMGDGMEFEC
ncbi:AraC family transcriptional regulator [Paenibacillus piri]|nr:AraC family transcriptional regulator [Paenibacillus piri]